MATAAISAGKETEMKSKKMPCNQVQSAVDGTISAEVRQLRIAEIVVPRQRARRLRDVTPLVESIAQSGLIEPIIVRRLPDGGLVLVCGAHRLEAHRRLGRDTILARIIEVSALEAELIELDENLERIELTVLERGEHLLRRKEIYEQLHPQTKQGGAPGKKGGGKQAKDATVASFAEDTSKKTGLSIRTIQDDGKIARLSDGVKKVIRGTPLEDQKRALLQITRIAPEKQMAVAEAVASGRYRTVQQAAVELGVKDKRQPRRQRGDIKARVLGVVEPLREVEKRWKRLAAGLDSASAPEARAIEEAIAALKEKINAFAPSVEVRSAATAIPNDARPKPSGAPTAARGDRSSPVVESTPSTGSASEETTLMLLSEDGFNEAIQVFQTQEHVTRIALDSVFMMSDDDPVVNRSRTRLQDMLIKSFEQLDKLQDFIDGKYTYGDYLREDGVPPSANENEKGSSRNKRSSIRGRYSLSEVIAKRWPPPSAQPQRAPLRARAASQVEARRGQTPAPTTTGAAAQVEPRAARSSVGAAPDRTKVQVTTLIDVRNEVANLFVSYMDGILQSPAHIVEAIQKKDWPPEAIEAALKIARDLLPPATAEALLGHIMAAS